MELPLIVISFHYLKVKLELDLHWPDGFVCLLAVYHLQDWCLNGDARVSQVC